MASFSQFQLDASLPSNVIQVLGNSWRTCPATLWYNHTWHAENSPFIDFIDGFVDYPISSMGLSWDLTFTDDFP
jgi:hypothetical protein